jgi:arylsulfatase A-like enzyme
MVAPRVATHVTGNIDLAPTIAAVAGVTPPSPVDGMDLTPLFADPSASISRTGVLIEHGVTGRAPPFCAYRTRRDVFIHYATGEEEYYRYRTDPFELENQAGRRRVRSAVSARRATTRSLCSPLPPGMEWVRAPRE